MNQIIKENKFIKNTQPLCYHCGDECYGAEIIINQKPFCCEGCKMVYSILNENDLCNYYDLNEVAGISQKNRQRNEYVFLDDDATITKLIDFKDKDKTKVHFYLPQIHCSSCLWLLEHLHRLDEGIQTSRVDFLKKEVSITFDHKITSLRRVVEMLAMIGYPPVIQLQDLESNKQPITDKSLYYKLGLAGFAFGNIMLLSFPEYLGMSSDSDTTLSEFFRFVNIILILPVILYSGQDYFRSAWQGLKHKHLNIDVPVSLGILALFSRSIFEILSHTGAGYLDSLAGLIFFLLIGKWFQQSTYAKIAFDRDYKSYFPIAATLKQGNQEIQLTLDKLKKGDLLVIRHGELIPTDSILINGDAKIDYSFVSGESALIERERGNLLYAGGRQMGGLIEVSVIKKVSNSYLTQLWNDHTFSKSNAKGEVSTLANKVASFFTIVILLIAFSTLAFWISKDMAMAVNAFTAVLIIACPCAVALSIPFTFGNVMRVLARQGIYLKNIKVIESLAKISHVVFDKTGTITNNLSSWMSYEGEVLSKNEEQWIKSLVHHSTHPLSRQISRIYENHIPIPVRGFSEEKGKGISGMVDGHFLRIGSQHYIQNPEGFQNEKFNQNVRVEIDSKVKGTFVQISQYRYGLKVVLQKLKTWAKLSLLSGDNDKEKSNLIPLFKDKANLHFNKKPQQKLDFIKGLQANNSLVAMVGDGLNDAGALNQSEVGIVITENTLNFTPACDIIMDASQFERLPLLFSFSKLSIRLVYIAYGIALLYNIIGLFYAVQGLLSPVIAAILMPLSSVSIVLFGVGMSTLLAHKNGLISKINKSSS